MTLDQFLQFLRSQKLERAAYLVGRYPDVVEPFLPKIAERLRAKGWLSQARNLPPKKPMRKFETSFWLTRSISQTQLKKGFRDLLSYKLGNYRIKVTNQISNDLVKAKAEIFREDKSKISEASFLGALSGIVPLSYVPHGARVMAEDPKTKTVKTGYLDWKVEDRHAGGIRDYVYIRSTRGGQVTGAGFGVSQNEDVEIADDKDTLITLAENQAMVIAVALALECLGGIESSCASKPSEGSDWPPKARAKNGEYNSKEFQRALFKIIELPEMVEIAAKAGEANEKYEALSAGRPMKGQPVYGSEDGRHWQSEITRVATESLSYIYSHPNSYKVTIDAAGARKAKDFVVERAKEQLKRYESLIHPSVWRAKDETALVQAAKSAGINAEDLVWLMDLRFKRRLPPTSVYGRFDNGKAVAQKLLDGETTIKQIDEGIAAENKKASDESYARNLEYLQGWRFIWDLFKGMARDGRKLVLANITREAKKHNINTKMQAYRVAGRGDIYEFVMENSYKGGPFKGWRFRGPEMSSSEGALYAYITAAKDMAELPDYAAKEYLFHKIDKKASAEQRGRQIWDALASGAL